MLHFAGPQDGGFAIQPAAAQFNILAGAGLFAFFQQVAAQQRAQFDPVALGDQEHRLARLHPVEGCLTPVATALGLQVDAGAAVDLLVLASDIFVVADQALGGHVDQFGDIFDPQHFVGHEVLHVVIL